MKTNKNASIHRFHDQVAISFEGAGTVYLSPKMAKKIANQLNKYARDCEKINFSNSQLTTKDLRD